MFIDSHMDGLTLDTANGHIYYTDTRLDKINRMRLDGSENEELVDLSDLTQSVEPRAIVLDVKTK